MPLSRLRQNRLAIFVDRFAEVEAFRRFLGNDDRTVLWIWADGGVGKTTLLSRLAAEGQATGLRVVELSGAAGRQLEPLDIMLSISGQIGEIQFPEFLDAIKNSPLSANLNFDFKSEGGVRVASGASLRGNTIDSISGVTIEQVNVSIVAPPISSAHASELLRITDCFLRDLAKIGDNDNVVVFFDAEERFSVKSRSWLISELIGAAIDHLNHIKIIVFSREKPAVNHEWTPFIKIRQLPTVPLTVVREYLEMRRVKQEYLEGAALAIFAYSQGNMLVIAHHVEELLAVERGDAS